MISAIITNYNGYDILKRDFQKIHANLCDSGVAEIIVVDDASSDQSVDYLNTYFPEVIVVSFPVNEGFSKASNAGAARASHPILLFLNNDVVPNSFDQSIVSNYFKDDSLFAISPKIIRKKNGKDFIESHTFGQFRLGQIDYGQTQSRYPKRVLYEGDPIFFACGGGAFISKDKFDQIGGFDLLYFPFYVEDVDLSFQAWRMGWQSLYTEKVSFFHYHSSTNSAYFSWFYIRLISKRNVYLFNWKMIDSIRHFISHILLILFKCVTLQIFDMIAIVKALILLPQVIKFKKRDFKYSTRLVLHKMKKPILL